MINACGKLMSILCDSFDASLLFEGFNGVEITLASGILRDAINLEVPLEWTVCYNEVNDEYNLVDSVHFHILIYRKPSEHTSPGILNNISVLDNRGNISAVCNVSTLDWSTNFMTLPMQYSKLKLVRWSSMSFNRASTVTFLIMVISLPFCLPNISHS